MYKITVLTMHHITVQNILQLLKPRWPQGSPNRS